MPRGGASLAPGFQGRHCLKAAVPELSLRASERKSAGFWFGECVCVCGGNVSNKTCVPAYCGIMVVQVWEGPTPLGPGQ